MICNGTADIQHFSGLSMLSFWFIHL